MPDDAPFVDDEQSAHDRANCSRRPDSRSGKRKFLGENGLHCFFLGVTGGEKSGVALAERTRILTHRYW
jgi:hypothetical protein